jgi:hypothetical protein
MFKIFNEIYYVDIDAIDEYVQFTAEVLEDDVETEGDVAELKEEKQIHLIDLGEQIPLYRFNIQQLIQLLNDSL